MHNAHCRAATSINKLHIKRSGHGLSMVILKRKSKTQILYNAMLSIHLKYAQFGCVLRNTLLNMYSKHLQSYRMQLLAFNTQHMKWKSNGTFSNKTGFTCTLKAKTTITFRLLKAAVVLLRWDFTSLESFTKESSLKLQTTQQQSFPVRT